MICFTHLFVDCRFAVSFFIIQYTPKPSPAHQLYTAPKIFRIGNSSPRSKGSTTPNATPLTGTIVKVTYPEEIAQYQNQAIPPISAVYENAVGENQVVVAG
jgi:hypothetical protein